MTKKLKLKNTPPLTAMRAEELAAMSDDDIDTSDIPELGDDFWKNARVRYPTETKEHLISEHRAGDASHNRSKGDK